MSEKIYRVAVVGCGTIAPNHLSALGVLENVKVVALCDVKKERAEAMRENFAPTASVYESFDELLSAETLDAVHIATPHYLHAKMAIKALGMGLNVFLEKPMCISREEIDALLEAERKSTGRICVSFQNRFNETTLLAKQIIAEDGGPIGAYGTVIWWRDEDYYLKSGWRGSKTTEGGGVLINQAIHTLDLLTYVMGKPRYVTATIANHHLKGKIDVEDSSEGLIEFESGKTASFYATTSFMGQDKTSVFIKTENHAIDILGEDIYVDSERVTPEASVVPRVGKACYGKGHFTLIRKFYEALESGERMPVTLEDAQWVVRILLAAYESYDEKTSV